MSTENPETDTDILLATPEKITLASGLVVNVERIKTRATLSLLRILMRGASDVLFSGKLDPNEDDFQQQLVFAVLFAIPEAPDETINFLSLMVSPAQLRVGNRLSKGDESWNSDQWDQLAKDLEDPDLEDLIDIIAALVKNEGPHIQALGKKLTGLVKTIGPSLQKTSSEESAPKKSSRRVSKATTPTTS